MLKRRDSFATGKNTIMYLYVQHTEDNEWRIVWGAKHLTLKLAKELKLIVFSTLKVVYNVQLTEDFYFQRDAEDINTT